MTKEAMRNTVDSRPFVPFLIKMVDGSHYKVETKDKVWLSTNGNVMVLEEGNDIKWIDVSLVMEIVRSVLGNEE